MGFSTLTDFDRGDRSRFRIVLAIIAIANIIPLYITWQAWGMDGHEYTGWPFAFYSRGGCSYHEEFDLLNCFGDVLVGIFAAHMIARAFKIGWVALFFEMRTWGVYYAEQQSSETVEFESPNANSMTLNVADANQRPTANLSTDQ